MKKKYKFKVTYTVEKELEIELDDSQQSMLLNADSTLMDVYLDQEGYATFIGDVGVGDERYEIDWYNEIHECNIDHNNTLAALDICFFHYNLVGDDTLYCDITYGNQTTEHVLKFRIINLQRQKYDQSVPANAIKILNIHR